MSSKSSTPSCTAGKLVLFIVLVIVAIPAFYLLSVNRINQEYGRRFSLQGEVSLRKFPFPYRAGLAICSDIDGTTTQEEFTRIQRFLNTNETTELGEGLGLEIGNSFMVFAPSSCAISYLSPGNSARQLIREHARAGYVDTLHSYGEKEDFSRSDAILAIDELKKDKIFVDVWVDHARTLDNLGNDTTFGLGDRPQTSYYHADLTLKYGIRFVWLGRVTMVIGQSSPISIRTFSTLYDSDHPFYSLMNIAKEFTKHFLAVMGERRYAMHKDYDLVRTTRLDDGRKVYEFIRFDNYWEGVARGATARRLAYVLSSRTLKRLKENNGYSIVYTHLGKNSDCSEGIPEETKSALKELVEEFREGNIYVTTTSRLLNYYIIHKYLDWSYQKTGDDVIIRISRINDPIFGSFLPTKEQLRGITFYVPEKADVKVFIGNEEVESLRKNSKDFTGRESVTIN